MATAAFSIPTAKFLAERTLPAAVYAAISLSGRPQAIRFGCYCPREISLSKTWSDHTYQGALQSTRIHSLICPTFTEHLLCDRCLREKDESLRIPASKELAQVYWSRQEKTKSQSFLSNAFTRERMT